jgi:class 3 adenylate cyclase/tetratricopeptide (TPR) repeat protein
MSTRMEMWLDQIGLGKYAGVFAENDVDLRTLPYLTEADLRDLGISLGHRKILLAAIADSAFRSAGSRSGESAAPTDKAETASAPEAERRLLTVLFCDLVGSTELSQSLDPEEMRDLSRRYQDAVAGAVTRYGGYVAKYLGDGVLAYFGWPRAYEDQAERSIRAGLEALDAVGALPVVEGKCLAARVGIATGQVVVGDLIGASSREEGAVAGETPNLAARLQEAAAPGQLVVASSTRRLIGAAFEIESLGERKLKGFQRHVPVYRIVGERQVESRFEAAHGGPLAALMGRSHELGFLMERWTSARMDRGQVVLISGEAGIGKSRLVRELAARVAETAPELIQLQCSPYHATSAFHPIIDRLTRAAGFIREDPASTRLDKLEEMLRQSGQNLSAVAPIYSELLSIDTGSRYGPLSLTPQQLKEQTVEILVERLVLLGTRSPVLMVVEDAHWIDPSTRDVFDRVVARIADLPILILFTHRPEWSTDWFQRYDHCSVLPLGRLDRPDLTALARAISGGEISHALIDDIVARADGVPLFVEELTRSALERESAQTGSAPVPLTLQASLKSRLDRLPQFAKEVVYVASVIGRDFDDQLLRKAAGLSPVALAEALAHLNGAQLIVKSGLAPAGHMFRHALIQDAAYQSLLTRTRRQYHRRIGEILVADQPEVVETQPELIARHFSETDSPETALPFWERAAVRALARSANFEAVNHCERALAIASQLRNKEARARAMLAATLTLGCALQNAGRLQEAMTNSRAAAEMARRLGDTTRFVQAVMDYDNALFLSNEVRLDSIELLKEAIALVGGTDDKARCQIMSRLARAHLLIGDEERGDDYNRRAEELARRVGDRMALLNILIHVFLVPPSARSRKGAADWRSAMDELFTLADELDEDDSRGRALSLDIYVSAEFGDRARMDDALNRLEILGNARQRMHVQWIARHGRAMQALLEGDFASAERHAEAALELGNNILGDPVEGVYGIQMFTIRREQNRLAEVAPVIKRFVDKRPGQAAWRPGLALIACDLGYAKFAQRSLDEIAETGFAFPLDAKRSTTLGYLAEVCASLEDCDRAEIIYHLLEPYADMTITAGVTTVCYGSAGRYLGQLATVLGDWDRAEDHFERAMVINQKMGAWPWLARTQHDYSRMLKRRGHCGDVGRADRLSEDALEIAARLNMVALTKAIVGRTH